MDTATIVAIVVASLAGLVSLYGVYVNRPKITAEAAMTNVDAAIKLRNEALEEAAENRMEIEQLKARVRELEIIERDNRIIIEAQEKQIKELQKELHELKAAYTDLPNILDEIAALKATAIRQTRALNLARARETRLINKIEQIRAAFDTNAGKGAKK